MKDAGGPNLTIDLSLHGELPTDYFYFLLVLIDVCLALLGIGARLKLMEFRLGDQMVTVCRLLQHFCISEERLRAG